MNDLLAYVPYCGTSPLPTEIWDRWNVDPILLFVLGVFVAWDGTRLGIFRSARTAQELHRRTFFLAGWGALSLGLISPLCALGVALFSARITQHMWLAVAAAPLLAFAHRGSEDMLKGYGKAILSPFNTAVLFAIALWIWHTPRLYALTFESDLVYWLMHITMTGSAYLLWRTLASNRDHGTLARVSAGFVTLVQMGLLGALITFAPRVLYEPHLLTATTWNLTALEDQQLGGLIMWVPAGVAFLLAALGSVYALVGKEKGVWKEI